MKRIILVGLALALAGGGVSEPSDKEIAEGMMRRFAQRTGEYSANLKAKAKKIGNGRWAVTMEAERYGQRRILNATAVMDKNGDIHYYTN